MIHSDEGSVELKGKAIDILVDISCVIERFLELSPDMLRDIFCVGLKDTVDIALRLVRNRENGIDECSAEETSDALNEYIDKILNGYKEEE